VRVEASVERSGALLAALEQGAVDLALLLSPEGRAGAQHLAELPLTWIASPRHQPGPAGAPLPLVLFEPPCAFRTAALAALDAAGLPWTVVFTSPSLAGLWAAVEAGLGVTVRTPLGMPRRLRALRGAGLPPLPTVGLWLSTSGAQHTVAAEGLQQILLDTLMPRLSQDARKLAPARGRGAKVRARRSR
jgi:DNA-binding transcriptional LysR family regulator